VFACWYKGAFLLSLKTRTRNLVSIQAETPHRAYAASHSGGVGAKTFLNPIVDEYSRMTDREMVSSVCCWRGTPSTAGRKRRRGGSQDSCCGWSGELGIVAVSDTAVRSVVERAAAEIHAVPNLMALDLFYQA